MVRLHLQRLIMLLWLVVVALNRVVVVLAVF